MSHQTKATRLLIISFLLLGLIGAGAGLDYFQVFANGQEVCPSGGGWTKVDDLSGKSYTYDAPSGKVIVETCYKAGTEVVYNTIDPAKSSVTVTSAVQFDLSHASFRLEEEKKEEPTPTPTDEPTPTPTDEPTPTPTDEPTPTPTEEPKQGSLSILGVCDVDDVVWTISNESENEISFTWNANNGQSGQGSVPAQSSINLKTNLNASSITLSYILNDTETKTEANIEACAEEPTPTPTEPPKEETPVPTPTDPTDPKSQVDPKPDLAAGGSGPSLGSLITLLVVSGASVGIVSYLVVQTKKKNLSR